MVIVNLPKVMRRVSNFRLEQPCAVQIIRTLQSGQPPMDIGQDEEQQPGTSSDPARRLHLDGISLPDIIRHQAKPTELMSATVWKSTVL